MRAGWYAELDGRTFRCSNPRRPRIRLFEDASVPHPDGFELEDDEWTRLVDRSQVSRLTEVTTVAVWHGRRVSVVRVFDAAGEALVEQWGRAPDAPHVTVVDRGCWQARVPLSELTEVVEEVLEYPV